MAKVIGMELGSAFISIGAKLDGLSAQLVHAKVQVADAGRQAGIEWGNAFDRVARGARWAFLGITAGSAVATYAAAQEIDAEQNLAASLQAVGKYSDALHAKLMKQAQALMWSTGITHEAIQEAMVYGLTVGNLGAEQVPKFTEAAIGLAQILRMDVVSAMRLLSKAAQGNFETFGRYGVVLDEHASQEQKMALVLDKAGIGFRIAQDRMKSLPGQLTNMRNATGEFTEAWGRALTSGKQAPAIFDRITQSLRGFTKALETDAGKTAVKAATATGMVVSGALGTVKYLAELTASIGIMKLAFPGRFAGVGARAAGAAGTAAGALGIAATTVSGIGIAVTGAQTYEKYVQHAEDVLDRARERQRKLDAGYRIEYGGTHPMTGVLNRIEYNTRPPTSAWY